MEHDCQRTISQIIVASLLLVVTIWLLHPDQPRILGFFHDDGIYASLARSITQHGEYRDHNLPETIQIAKYPPGLPLLLSPYFLFGESPDGLMLYSRIMMLVILAMSLWLILLLSRRVSWLQSWHASAIAIIVLFHPDTLDYLRFPLTEIPFALCCLSATLLLVDPRQDESWKRALLLCGVVCTAIALRMLGIALVLGVISYLYVLGYRRLLSRFSAVTVPLIIVLLMFCSFSARMTPGFEDIQLVSLPYTTVFEHNIGNLASMASITFVRSIHAVHNLVLPYNSGLILKLPEPAAWRLMWLCTSILIGLIGTGVWRWRSRQPIESMEFESSLSNRLSIATYLRALRPWHWFYIYTLIALCCFPYLVIRYWYPYLPFFLIDLTGGIQLLLKGKWGGGALLLIAMSIAVVSISRQLPLDGDRAHYQGNTYRVAETIDQLEQLKKELPGEAVLAGTYDPLIAWYSDRSTVHNWSMADEYLEYFTGEFSLFSFYSIPEKDDRFETMYERAPEVYENLGRLGVTHLVFLPQLGVYTHSQLLFTLIQDLTKNKKIERILYIPNIIDLYSFL